MGLAVRWAGTAEDLNRKLAELPGCFAGTIDDPSGAVKGVLLAVGMTVLGLVKEAYVVKASGGTDAMGVKWPALAPATLILRKIVATPAAIKRMQDRVGKLRGPERQAAVRRIKQHFDALKGLTRGRTPADRAARSQALKILEKKRKAKTVSDKQYKEKKAILTGGVKDSRLKEIAVAGAFAEILRDTDRMLNSLTPGRVNFDQIVSAGPGFVEVGSNVEYFKFHNSAKPRRLKKDGTPVLPRRQVLPDGVGQFPAEWTAKVKAAFVDAMDLEFWKRYLGPQAS